jgi:acetyltransferase-like isoleucine patch superfamily enzyme
MKPVKRFLQRIVLKLISVETIELIERELAERKIQRCGQSVVMGNASKFYEEAKVINMTTDPSRITIGANTHIRGELLIFPYGGRIVMGDHCYIGEGTRIWSGEQIKLGDNVLIAHNVNIIDFSHEKNAADRSEGFKNLIKNGHPKVKGKIPTAGITIEDDVAIYADVHIMMGITVGKGSVLAAGSVVTKDVPPFSLMSGNPARRIWKLK